MRDGADLSCRCACGHLRCISAHRRPLCCSYALCLLLPLLLLLLLLRQDAATAGPACITASDGTCVIDLAAAKSQKAEPNAAGASAYQPFEDGASYTAVITAEGHGPLVVPDVPNSARYRSSSSAGKEYVATLVLDRKLVKPGDDLHVTGEWAARAWVGGVRMWVLQFWCIFVTPVRDAGAWVLPLACLEV